jgi:lipoate synthase
LTGLVEQDTFKEYEMMALAKGFKAAFCGSFVRSSYMAHRVWSATSQPNLKAINFRKK